MPHIFGYPAAEGYTKTVTLDPTLVTIQDEATTEPVQRFKETADGTHWVFQLAGSRKRSYEVVVDFLHEEDVSGRSGYKSLKQFFDMTTNWMMSLFDLRHDDGEVTPVRLMQESWQFTEVQKNRWSGRFLLRKSVTQDPQQQSQPTGTFSM